MSWNYRLFKKKFHGHEETYLEIHEVYYDEKGEIEGWTENAVKPIGMDVEEVKNNLDKMLQACEKPVLEESKLELLKELKDV